MDATQETVSPATADPAFTAQDNLATLWFKAYQGEVTGEVLFGALAALAADPEQRRKMEVLSRLETRTKEACVPALQRIGMSTDADAKIVSDARALAEVAATLAWTDLLASFEPITSQFVLLYQRIGEVSPADRAESELLVAHELALAEFARREMAGRTEDSLELIEALPHMA